MKKLLILTLLVLSSCSPNPHSTCLKAYEAAFLQNWDDKAITQYEKINPEFKVIKETFRMFIIMGAITPPRKNSKGEYIYEDGFAQLFCEGHKK